MRQLRRLWCLRVSAQTGYLCEHIIRTRRPALVRRDTNQFADTVDITNASRIELPDREGVEILDQAGALVKALLVASADWMNDPADPTLAP